MTIPMYEIDREWGGFATWHDPVVPLDMRDGAAGQLRQKSESHRYTIVSGGVNGGPTERLSAQSGRKDSNGNEEN